MQELLDLAVPHALLDNPTTRANVSSNALCHAACTRGRYSILEPCAGEGMCVSLEGFCGSSAEACEDNRKCSDCTELIKYPSNETAVYARDGSQMWANETGGPLPKAPYNPQCHPDCRIGLFSATAPCQTCVTFGGECLSAGDPLCAKDKGGYDCAGCAPRSQSCRGRATARTVH